jgi:hypothetical protein
MRKRRFDISLSGTGTILIESRFATVKLRIFAFHSIPFNPVAVSMPALFSSFCLFMSAGLWP